MYLELNLKRRKNYKSRGWKSPSKSRGGGNVKNEGLENAQ